MDRRRFLAHLPALTALPLVAAHADSGASTLPTGREPMLLTAEEGNALNLLPVVGGHVVVGVTECHEGEGWFRGLASSRGTTDCCGPEITVRAPVRLVHADAAANLPRRGIYA